MKSFLTRTAININVNESLDVGCIEKNDKSFIWGYENPKIILLLDGRNWISYFLMITFIARLLFVVKK